MADDKTKTPSDPVKLRLVKYGAADTFGFSTAGDNPDSTIASNAALPEDEFQNFYMGGINDHGVIQPPWDMRRLEYLCNENNALMPCIAAMEVNIDGTGYDFEKMEQKDAKTTDEAEDPEDDAKIAELKEFFDQPWPGESFVTIRRKLRFDLERTGNGYLEVIRDNGGKITFIRHVDAKMVRIVKLSQAVPVKKTIIRQGKPTTVTVMERQRRYVQLLNGLNLFFFKDFGVERDLNKRTGTWAQDGQRISGKDRATEMIHFTIIEDVHTPYGIPRWIHQLPSILGSRMAEEFNMEFFNTGGVPPALIVLQGGVLGTQTRQALESKTGGMAFKKNRIQILEVEPAGGTIDSAPNVRVHVERFGQERQQDSMFEAYDDKCETRVRRAFRLPPIFVGAAQDYSFATAFASYTVAEAQVFKPERDEFDEQMSQRLLPAMGYDGYRMKSKPLNIEDATLQMQGIEVAMATNVVDPEDVLDEVNKAVGINLKANPNRVEQLNQAKDMEHALNMNPEVPGEAKIDPVTGKPVPTQATRPTFDPKNPLAGIPLTSTTAGSTVPSPKGPTGKGATTIRPPKAPTVKPPGLGNVKKGDLAFVSEAAHLLKFNPYHKPAGTTDGGQFTSGPGGQGTGKPSQPALVAAAQGAANLGGDDQAGVPQSYGPRSGGHHADDVSFDAPVAQAFDVKPEAKAYFDKIGAASPSFYELEPGDPQAVKVFSEAITGSKDGNPMAAAVYVYPAEDYAHMRLFLTKEGKAGFALKGDDIVSVFNTKGSPHKNVALSILQLAVNQGGRRLDAFDTVLPRMYALAGFRTAARLKWDDEQAPPDWDKKAFGNFNGGQPDVVFMAYDPERKTPYKKGEGGYASDYGDALDRQEKAVQKYAPLKKSDGLKALALDTTLALRKRDYASVAKNLSLISSLDAPEQAAFNEALADLHFIDPAIDYAGMAALATLTASVMTQAAE